MRLSLHKKMLARTMIPAGVVWLALGLLPSAARGGDTFAKIHATGVVRCGVNEALRGFAQKDAQGHWTGLNVDFCRAVAAAVLGDAEKVDFVPLRASARFLALQSGEIDLLVRNTTWTLEREAGLGVHFVGTLFYNGQTVMVPPERKVSHIAELNGVTMCIEKGTNHNENLTAMLGRTA
jgi:general L-amino acid transport system substrate-binding protein